MRNYQTERARLRERVNNLNTELTNYIYLEGQHATNQELTDAMAGFRQREREISNAHAANERRLAAVLHAPRFGGGTQQSRIAVAPEEEEPDPDDIPPSIPIMDEMGLGDNREELIREVIQELESRQLGLLYEKESIEERLDELADLLFTDRPMSQQERKSTRGFGDEYGQRRNDYRRIMRELTDIDEEIARLRRADVASRQPRAPARSLLRRLARL